ncbi:hypothetical protein BIV57_16010 [Mangrovactinospora gilvigrisea]|uniref:Protein kinase domain-containing protein n=1 Tax=Mangrovactinospora gilvigrisea TaxID=1428644 RepID=A0A1J7BD04_9ACTN|nr:serine/threonine-protein kinase [Mangrovactinospora gilvigrisea]OIV36469.1 hypothetical protein BIV57_16010 [Mangrovactinospora gilvigrisea]
MESWEGLAPPLPLEPGDPETLGPYRLLARLGAGGMGRVYLARSSGGRRVAVKAVRLERAAEPVFRSRFRDEVSAARTVQGGFAVPVVDADTEAGLPWVATDYVLGPSLAEAVRLFGPLPEPSLRALGSGLAVALRQVHAAGLTHRDVSPGNVLLDLSGPRLIDFGIARAAQESDPGLGSLGFMAPEQLDGAPVTPAADVFALAATVVFAATGRGPFPAESQAGMVHRLLHGEPDLTGVPDPLRAVLAACLDRDPARRPDPAVLAGPGGAEPLLTAPEGWLPPALAAAVAERASAVLRLTEPLTTRSGTGRRARRFPAWAPPVAAAVVLLLGAGAAFAAGDPLRHRPTPPLPTTIPRENDTPPKYPPESSIHLPAGFRLAHDPAGFTVAVAQDAGRQVANQVGGVWGTFYFGLGSGDETVSILHNMLGAGSDVVGSWALALHDEKATLAKQKNYQRYALKPVKLAMGSAAEIDYTYTDTKGRALYGESLYYATPSFSFWRIWIEDAPAKKAAVAQAMTAAEAGFRLQVNR